MSDGISDGYSAFRDHEEWVNKTVPYIEKNLLKNPKTLDSLKPEELTVHENHLVYLYYGWKSDRLKQEISRAFGNLSREYWNAYMENPGYKHYKRKGVIKVKVKELKK